MSKQFMIKNNNQNNNQKNKLFQNFLIVPFYLLLTTSLITIPVFNNIASAQAQKNSSLLQRGNRLLKRGWVNDAIKVFQQAIKRNPKSIKANFGLATAYNRAGNIDKAWNFYQRVLEIDPNYQPALKTVGLLGTYRTEWQLQGIEALSRLLNFSPSDLEARSLRALLYYYQGRVNDSVADYQILLSKNPTPKTTLAAAETFTYAGNYKQALELFNRYLSTGKSITKYPAVAYARTLRKTGNPTEAVKVLKAQLTDSNNLDSLQITTRAELSQAYVANGQPTEALAVLEPLRGKANAGLSLARALNEIRKLTNDSALVEEVAKLYQQALTNNSPPSTSLLLEVANVFSGLPQKEQTALKLYQQAALKLPNDKSLVLYQLALQNKLDLISQKDLRNRLTNLLENLPQDAIELQKFANALVQINTRNPEFISSYQRVLQKGVKAPFLNFRIAQMYLRKEDTIGAKKALAAYQATSEGAENLATQLLAAEIKLQEGDLEASAQSYQSVLNQNPQDKEIFNGALRALAGIRSQQKRFDEALMAYNQLRTRQPQNLVYELGLISVAYQAKRIDQQQATKVADNWLATQKATSTPPELYSLIGQLPANPEWESLYKYLLQFEPNNLQIQKRLLQVVAQRDNPQARALAKQFAANKNNQYKSNIVQGQLFKAIGELDLAGMAYENILANQPNDMDALTALGGIRFEQRQYKIAQKIYSQILVQKPQNTEAMMAIADLYAVLDKPIAALSQMEQLQVQKNREGVKDKELSRRIQQVKEDFLLRRGFQPYWEDPNRRIRN
ncbi:tetratricopeptide repeat family protein [Calothrix parasitica NIES-267]|uniref:Tetratricopeptide repeat family protein n=1 Tax=Calothrix parasitica NIES-267 TaxID=1973488 RepID=A0A1Z4LZN3_9CYAN|nr:tetratricopeptide repeat family protein [Calothrix parasitica NIES-267]